MAASTHRRRVAVFAALGALALAGCSDSGGHDANYVAHAPGASDSTTSSSDAAPSAESSSPSSAEPTESSTSDKQVDPSRFAVSGNKYAFRLSGSNDGCWYGASGGTDFACDLSLDGVKVYSAMSGTQRDANQVSSRSAGDRFQLTVNELGGGHNYDLQPLAPGESTEFDGVTCTALGPTSLSCSRGTSSFTFKDGTISVDGQSVGTSHATSNGPNSSASDVAGPGGSCGVYAFPYRSDEVFVGANSAPISCAEVKSTLDEYFHGSGTPQGSAGFLDVGDYRCASTKPAPGTFGCSTHDGRKSFTTH